MFSLLQCIQRCLLGGGIILGIGQRVLRLLHLRGRFTNGLCCRGDFRGGLLLDVLRFVFQISLPGGFGREFLLIRRGSFLLEFILLLNQVLELLA